MAGDFTPPVPNGPVGGRSRRPERPEGYSRPGTGPPSPGPPPPKPDDNNTNEAIGTLEWFKKVESRLKAVETSKASDDKSDDDADLEGNQGPIATKTGIRECNFEEFKNRYTSEVFAIEVLNAHESPVYEAEMTEEQLRRLPRDKRAKLDYVPPRGYQPGTRQLGEKAPEKPGMKRIRINSKAILLFLSRVTGEHLTPNKPHTFLRPFRILRYFHDKAEEEFKKLEKKFPDFVDTGGDNKPATDEGDAPAPAPAPASTQEDASKSAPDEQPAAADNLDSIDRAGFHDIKCYMEFARSQLIPVYHMYDDADHRKRTKIRYEDLDSLFRVGELVVQRRETKRGGVRVPSGKNHGMDSESESESEPLAAPPPADRPSDIPKLFRAFMITHELQNWGIDDMEKAGGELCDDFNYRPDYFTLHAYYIDFDGTSYAAESLTRTFEYFEGEKDVLSLPFYPLRFEKNHEHIMETLQERGRRFHRLMGNRNMAMPYRGWTVTRNQLGNPIMVASFTPGRPPIFLSSKFIESDVIIDFQEAYYHSPLWRPAFQKYGKKTFAPEARHDEFPIIQWADTKRSKIVKRTFEAVVVDDNDITALEWNAFAENDSFVVDHDTFDTRDTVGQEKAASAPEPPQEFSDEDFALLPARMLVYSLWNRKFVNIDIKFLREPRYVDDPFSELRISDRHKALIQGAVQDHFDKKMLQKKLESSNEESMEQDFIRGKGRGLVFLLHGAPGVGKTATAEAVAYAHRKPLFPITCGDLGIEPMGVEAALSEIFRLANLWDCVLLLDEAEIFLSHREKKDDNIQRNALVSIFLRTLEYYPGILFLTTNRVGALDEALNSRVHISIFYPQLDGGQTLALFNLNLRRSEMIARQRAKVTGNPELEILHDEIREWAINQFSMRQVSARSARRSPSSRMAGAGAAAILQPWWNGRQIRNAFQIATSLAYAATDADGRRKLGKRQFEQVQATISEYDSYREQLFEKTDNEHAKAREERIVPRVDHDGVPRGFAVNEQAGYGGGTSTQHLHPGEGGYGPGGGGSGGMGGGVATMAQQQGMGGFGAVAGGARMHQEMSSSSMHYSTTPEHSFSGSMGGDPHTPTRFSRESTPSYSAPRSEQGSIGMGQTESWGQRDFVARRY